jgi:ankyrin repeat protein
MEPPGERTAKKKAKAKARAPHRAKKADRALAPAMTAEAKRALLGKASCEGDLAGAQRAVEAGADPDEAAFFPLNGSVGGTCTAAFVAAYKDRIDVLRFLVGDAGADPDKGDTTNGQTPCHVACAKGNDGSVRVLLAAGADPDRASTDGLGFTPCMVAARFGRVACLRALREGSPGGALASVNAVGTGGRWEGKTALDLAEVYNHEEAAAFLRDELGALRAADL